VKPRSFFTLLLIVVVLCLSLTGAGLYWALSQSSLDLLKGGATYTPRGAAFVPKQAPALASLLVNPERLESFAQLAVNPGRRRRSQAEIEDFIQSLLAKTGLDYGEEIRPWLGEEVTWAITSLDYDRDAGNGAQPGYLLTVHSRDPQRSREFLQLHSAEASLAGEADLVFEQYQGVNLTYQKPRSAVANSALLASAVVGDYVLFANHPQVLRSALTALQAPSLSLEENPSYQQALAQLEQPRVGFLYANFPALSAWLGNRGQSLNPGLDQTLTLEISLRSEGLLINGALSGLTPLAALSTATAPTPAPVPPQAALVLSSRDLNGFWNRVQDDLPPASPLQQTLAQLLERLDVSLGLDIAETIFPALQGDYQLILLPGPAWVLTAERTEGADWEQVWNQLDGLAQSQGYTLSSLPVLGQTVSAWTTLTPTQQGAVTTLEAQVKGAHLTLGEREIFATSLEALSQVLNPQGETPSALSQTLGALPEENLGYLYVDWPASREYLSQQIPVLRVLELSLRPLFQNLRSVAFGAPADGETALGRGTVYLKLGVNPAS
jgi:hypothetical protein